MRRRSKAAGWAMAAVLAAAALLLSLALPMLVPDYRNTIRAVDYDRGVIASAAADEEIELYPWTEFRAEDCRTIAELDRTAPEIREEVTLEVLYMLKSLLQGGFLKDYDFEAIEAEMEQDVLYDETQGRLYARNLTVETWDGEAALSFAFSGNGLEYLEIALPWEKEVMPEKSGEIQWQFRELLGTFRAQYFGYYGSGEYENSLDGAGNGAADGYAESSDGAVPYDETSEPAPQTDTGGGDGPAVPENVLDEFYNSIYLLQDGIGQYMGWEIAPMIETAFMDFSCEIIPYQGKFLLVFSNENADAEMILIYSPAAERISGFSLRF